MAALLPTGGTPDCLDTNFLNPQTTSAGVFAGQLIAATLNVVYDAAGIGKCTLTGDCTFPHDPGTLGTLVYQCGPLAGYSVNDVIALANVAIGDCDESAFTYSELSDALAMLNEEFVDCEAVATGCLMLPEYKQIPVSSEQELIHTNEMIEDSAPEAAQGTTLFQNVPNPFNPYTKIEFYLAESASVDLRIYDISGRMIKHLASGEMAAGQHSVTWDSRDDRGVPVSSSVYFYTLKAGDYRASQRMTLLK